MRGRSTAYEPLPEGGYYQVPLRSLIVDGVDNLFAAGRCVSADHDALASLRVMAPSMALGQAAGVAARHAAKGDVVAADVQAELLEQGAFIG